MAQVLVQLAVLQNTVNQFIATAADRHAEVNKIDGRLEKIELWQASVLGSLATFRWIVGSALVVSTSSLGVTMIAIIRHGF
jgi:hypothetical protein